MPTLDATDLANIAAAILATPANKLATMTGGRVDVGKWLGAVPAGLDEGDGSIPCHVTYLNDGSISTAAFADGAIDSNVIGAGAVTAVVFAADAIDANAFSQAAANKVWTTTVRTVTGLTAAAQTDVRSALTAQGYTVTRSAYLDFLNVGGLVLTAGHYNETQGNLDELLTANQTDVLNAVGVVDTKAGAIQAIFSGITSLANWLRLFGRKDAPDATALSELNESGGAYDATTDSQEAIRDRNEAAFSGGVLAGPNSVTVTFKDASNVVVPNVPFTVLGKGSGQANGSGVATFGLPGGSFTLTASITNGVVFSNTAFTVSGMTLVPIAGAAPSLPSSSNPAQCSAYLDCYDRNGEPESGVTLHHQMMIAPAAAATSFNRAPALTPASDVAGRLVATLARNATYDFWRGNGPRQRVVVGPSDATKALPQILSAGST